MFARFPKAPLLVLLFCASMSSLVSPAGGQDPSSRLLLVKPKADIDENLFLIRNIEHTFQTWCGPSTAPVELQTWLAATRTSLSQLRKTAEFDNLDSRVVSAYGDLLSLLDDYEEFLARADLVTFISDVHRAQVTPPNSKSLVLDGASAGGQVGAIAGSFFGPLGTAVAGAGGAAIGAISGIRDALRECRENAKINTKIDQATKDYIAKRTVELESRFASAYKTQQLVAHRLAAEKNWGSAVGFEQTELTLEQQRENRPNDPFLLVQIAMQGEEPAQERAMLCYQASRLVPQDRVPDVDVYDTFRASFLLVGAEISCAGAIKPDRTYDEKNAKGAIRLHKTATSIVNSSLPLFAYETYADAQAFSGNLEEAAREYAELLKAGYSGDRFLYNYACTCSRRGEIKQSLELLTQSFGSIPRFEPEILDDPDLKNLLAVHKEEVEALCFPALIGEWKNKSLHRHKFVFEPDGTCTEVTFAKNIKGTYQFTSKNRFKLTQEGVMWGKNTGELQFDYKDGELKIYLIAGNKTILYHVLIPDVEPFFK